MLKNVTIDGVEYAPVTPVTDVKIVRASNGYRDYIYVGRVEKLPDGDYRVHGPCACIRVYKQKGLTGAAQDPSLTTLDKSSAGVTIKGSTVVDVLDCGPAWDGVL